MTSRPAEPALYRIRRAPEPSETRDSPVPGAV